jgi:hypothetical protein
VSRDWSDYASEWFSYLEDRSDTKKLLRFGCDNPQCVKCGSTDRRSLCSVAQSGKTEFICRNCRAQHKPSSPKATTRKAKRFEDEGYHKPACVVCNHPFLQVLELDHVAHAANGDLVAPLCANCHAFKSYLAEAEPMAALRLRDPRRSALVLQAAFEMGFGAILGMIAAWDGMRNETARSIFLGVGSALLFAWALWNLAADDYFEGLLGPGYDRAIPAPVPR